MNNFEIIRAFELIDRFRKENHISEDEYDYLNNVCHIANTTWNDDEEKYASAYLDGYMAAQKEVKDEFLREINGVIGSLEDVKALASKQEGLFGEDYHKTFNEGKVFGYEYAKILLNLIVAKYSAPEEEEEKENNNQTDLKIDEEVKD